MNFKVLGQSEGFPFQLNNLAARASGFMEVSLMPFLSLSSIAQRLMTLSLVLAAIAIMVKPSTAACTGTSPNLTAPTWSDVMACHNLAASGDTITVRAGSYTVTAPTNITKYVKIVAGGTVTLTDNSCAGYCGEAVASMLILMESPVGSIRFEGFTINQGTAQHSNPGGVIYIGSTTSGKPVVIINNSYHAVNNDVFIHAGSNRGVISHNTEIAVVYGGNCLNGNIFVNQKMASGDSWTTPPFYGMDDVNGDKNLYVEDNTITDVTGGIDGDDYGRMVFRYNTFINGGGGSHGSDTSGTGARYVEVYNNTFVRDASLKPNCAGGTLSTNYNSWLFFRGGTALIHHNVIPNLIGMWGDKPEVVFALENLRRNAGPFRCWNTITAPGAGYPAARQTGWGYSTGGTNPGGLGVHQDLEPIYLWGNTGTGDYNAPVVFEYSPNDCGANAPTAADYIKQNREYYVNTAKPGYTPYTYPHPLTSPSSGSTNTGRPRVSISISDQQ